MAVLWVKKIQKQIAPFGGNRLVGGGGEIQCPCLVFFSPFDPSTKRSKQKESSREWAVDLCVARKSSPHRKRHPPKKCIKARTHEGAFDRNVGSRPRPMALFDQVHVY
jgi:hypothetical protein